MPWQREIWMWSLMKIWGFFEPLKEQLSHIRDGFKKAVAQEVKSERTKSELITNVSMI